jgi:hypothetical protein
MNKKFNFYSRFESGHREDYINFTKSNLGGNRTTLIYGFLNSKPLLFLMIEECFMLYCIIAFIRALLGFKTIGFVFRAKKCIASKQINHKIKVILLKYFKKFQNISSISIVPFYTCEGIAEICDDWLYDFQFWDMGFLEKNIQKTIVDSNVEYIKGIAKGRKVICAIGKQDQNKGFDVFSSLYILNKHLQEEYLFVSGGVINGILTSQIEKFISAGALVINERITNEMLIALYKSADLIWVCYSPNYDQSSGVLGRAIQYKLPVIVRTNSVVENIVDNLKHEKIAVDLKTPILAFRKNSGQKCDEFNSNEEIISRQKFFDIIS